MTTILDHARDVLTLAGYDMNETRDLPHGWQLRCAGGQVVCVYKTGAVVAQGRNAAAVKALFDGNPMPKQGAVAKPKAAVKMAVPVTTETVQEPFIPRFPEGWSEVWSPGDVPF